MESVYISIVIPSYNGKEKVLRLLHALEKQTYLSFEVIVVIDGSTDGSAKAILENNWKLFPVIILEQKNKGRAGARNAGFKQAQAKQILFLDDDMIPESNCAKYHVEAFLTHTNAILMGQVIEPCTDLDKEIKQYKNFLNKAWSIITNSYKLNYFPVDLTVLSAQNMSLSTEVFNQLNGFNETLKDIEDYDLALRAKLAEIPTYYLDTALAEHQDDFTFKKYADRSKAYFQNRLLAKKLNPDLYKNDSILNHKHGFLLQILYKIFKYPVWLNMFDSWNILPFCLPKKLRYKLYGVVITAYIHNQDK
jgi:GT2 family glycosyltransferase